MRWIGQHIWDFISRFRNDVYFENLQGSAETTALVVDADGKVTTNSLSSGGGNGEASLVRLPVRFKEGVVKGDPVYISGYNNGQDRAEVKRADCDSAAHMPAFGLADADYSNNDNGFLITIGNLHDIDTQSYSVGDTLYVASGGGLTNTKPATEAKLIQNVGVVARSQQNHGEIEVVATGRSNDTPNLDQDAMFLGNASNQMEQVNLNSVGLSKFNNDAGFTTNTGDITEVIGGTNIDVTGGTSGAATVNLPDHITDMVIIQGENRTGGETESQEPTLKIRSFKHLFLEFDADDTDTDGKLEFLANGASVGSLDQAGNLVLRGVIKSQNADGSSHFPSKGSSGNILVDDSGEIKTRPVSDIKGDLSLAKGDVGLGSAENKSSATIRGEIVSGNIPNNAADTSGNSATATKLAATKTINGVAFDGSSNITVTAAGSTLSDVVPIAKGGTGAASAGGARLTLGVDVAGTDNSTDVTLAGEDYLSLSGQEITANDIDLTDNVTGILPIANGGTGSSNQKVIQVFPMNFVDELGTTKHYMPFVTNAEQTVNYQEEAAMVMPADGRVVSVTVHMSQMHDNDGNITIGIETSPCGQSYTNAWTIEETAVLPATQTDDHHVFHFAFDDAKHFESTDKMAISIQQTAAMQNANRFFWVTAVVEYDWSTFLAGSNPGQQYTTTP